MVVVGPLPPECQRFPLFFLARRETSVGFRKAEPYRFVRLASPSIASWDLFVVGLDLFRVPLLFRPARLVQLFRLVAHSLPSPCGISRSPTIPPPLAAKTLMIAICLRTLPSVLRSGRLVPCVPTLFLSAPQAIADSLALPSSIGGSSKGVLTDGLRVLLLVFGCSPSVEKVSPLFMSRKSFQRLPNAARVASSARRELVISLFFS